MNKNTTGLVLGSLLGLFHLAWSLLVATGVAQVVLDWIYKIHFLNNPFVVGPFNVVTAAVLVGFTFLVGYVLGMVFATLWNSLRKK